ncbi:MAG: hypothetical protein G3W63_19505 [Xanthomonas euvesicatoria]|nr:hypothetical protein [Xanthomonas euvesicatoria]
MFTQLKAIIAGAILLVVVIIAGLIYWRGSSNATTKNDLRIARETIKVEREALKVTSQIDMRVNAEGIQTANTAQEATREIESIRQAVRVPELSGAAVGPVSAGQLGADAARVLQLAREARAAAVASSARLQPAVDSGR